MAKPLRDPGLIEFEAVVERSDVSNASAFVEFPFDLKETYGIGNLVPVNVTFDGIPYTGSIAKMGAAPLILIKKEIREQLRKERGETVKVTVQLDASPREVIMPADFAGQLKLEGLEDYFGQLAYTHRKEYVNWIVEAKQEATRERRIEKAIELLKQKKPLR